VAVTKDPLPPIDVGTVINDRYEVLKSIGKGGMGEVFLAFDRLTQQQVALKVVPEASAMPGDDEALRQEVILAQKARHPNVCRVHDLAPSPWGPILVMEYIPGQTLHNHIRKRKTSGGFSADEFRKISTDVCAGLAAIHQQGLVHGDLKPGNVMVADDRAVILDFGFAKERARAAVRKPGAPPDGGTPHYMSPERLRSGGASPEDDVYAAALTLWEMWTCRVPEPGYKPRLKTMKQQITFDVPAALTNDEIRQIFRALNPDPQMRPQARHMRFFNPTQTTTAPIQLPRERIDPGPAPGRAIKTQFTPGAQSLLITYATNAPDSVATLFPLQKPVLSIGRRSDQDLVLAEATVSGSHALLRWQTGSWLVEDLNSTNGTYADFPFERKAQVSLLHGAEVQLGECRLMVVTFGPDSPHHDKAKRYLARRDGLTGMLVREHLMKAIDEDGFFAEWAEVPMQIARFELRGQNGLVSLRPTILEMLALRKAALQVVDLTQTLLLSLTPAAAGRTGPLTFVVSIVGPNLDEAQHVVEQVVAQVQGTLPETLELTATLVKCEPGRPARTLID
jgi:eukaryotic-like serine/threonine-protein kinase